MTTLANQTVQSLLNQIANYPERATVAFLAKDMGVCQKAMTAILIKLEYLDIIKIVYRDSVASFYNLVK